MILTRMQVTILGAAVLLAPMSLMAQTNSGGMAGQSGAGGQSSGSGTMAPGSPNNGGMNPGSPTNGTLNPGSPASGGMNPGASTSGGMNPGASRNSGMSGQDTSATGMSNMGAGHSMGQAAKDKAFVMEAAQGGLAEIKLGQLAVQKGSSDQVHMIGQKMVDDHTQLNNDMKPIADSMGVTVPTDVSAKDQAEYDKLNGMSGKDFDKEYLSYMVTDHHKDLRDFRKEAATAKDPSLKAAVTKGEKVIAEHTKMVEKAAKANGATASM